VSQSTSLPPLCNAWIFLNEDEPKDQSGNPVGYNDPSSSYQRLISHKIYAAVDMLCICFAEAVPTSATTVPGGTGDSYTLQMGQGQHPGGLTNQDYLAYIIRDARAVNPGIKLLMTLVWGNAQEINDIFRNSGDDAAAAAAFAANLVAYLDQFGLDGLDIDWEYPLSSSTTEPHMTALMSAIGTAFAGHSRKLWFTLSPNDSGNLDAATVNANVDFLNLQLYGAASPSDFTSIGIDAAKLAYGAKFESGYQDAQSAYSDYVSGGYSVATQWRLNSDNFVFEQDQQVLLWKAVHGC
jgi:hypothetical protein